LLSFQEVGSRLWFRNTGGRGLAPGLLLLSVLPLACMLLPSSFLLTTLIVLAAFSPVCWGAPAGDLRLGSSGRLGLVVLVVTLVFFVGGLCLQVQQSPWVILGLVCFSFVLGLGLSCWLVGGLGGIASFSILSALVFLSHRKQTLRSLLHVGHFWFPFWKAPQSHIHSGSGTQSQIGAMSLPQPRQLSIAGSPQVPHFSAGNLTVPHWHRNLIFCLASQSHPVSSMLARGFV
jgi:hypothetical protein